MSKSRLEKFLYALYSIDSSDLPNPLSRIEELYKCLVTGEEAPSFEPISRTEKYLMAILGVYGVNELPNPISRVEVLLYKLATGDDNLDDIKSFLSEHEELLAEIIRNGSVGGDIDIEYVLYTLSTEFNTLYNTAEKPVKSAILKGNTLVNLHKLEKYSVYGVVLDGGINQHFGSDTSYATWRMYDISMLRPDTEYGVFCWVLENTLSKKPWCGHYYHSNDTVFNASTELNFSAGETGLKFAKLTTISDFTGKTCGIRHLIDINTPSSEYVKFRCVIVEYQEGMENWDIPYFEGMGSVKLPVLTTTGKNLFNNGFTTASNYDNQLYSRVNLNKIIGKNGNFTISVLEELNSKGKIWFNLYINGTEICNLIINGVTGIVNKYNFLLNEQNQVEFGLYCEGISKQQALEIIKNDFKIQIEESSHSTTYEPFKSNILTCNEEVKLGGVGDVRDELDCLTGELTERIGEVVLNGSEGWSKEATNDTSGDTDTTTCYFTHISGITKRSYPKLLCDEFPVYNVTLYNKVNDYEGIAKPLTDERIFIRINKSRLETQNVTGFKQWLSQNPITVKYQLKTESVKTVDLSVVDQDGNNTELSTFDDLTHVTLSSEGLIPEAELEVATKNEEDLEDTSVYTTHTLGEEFNTLYNTAKKPVKSAILKGQTLVNVHPTDYIVAGSNPTFYFSKIIPKTMIKPNTRYFLRLYNTHQYVMSAYFKPCVKNRVDFISSDNKCAVFTTKSEFADSDFGNNKIHFYSSSALALEDVKDTKVILCEYIDGMENWDIPYFEGMQSVKMPVLTTSNEDGTKTNILTVNEDVTLRSNGSVYDELDLLTGKLTQRIDEDGSVLTQEVVKTVDLSVVDQDGDNTKLSTFNDLTHVTLSSEGLIPEAELEVAEKVPEVAASMLTISREQEVINATANEQSENVDSTMIATTEIYEQLL